ncbi:hypothetical protein E8E14_002782 [Neopestalotiopsis sp. 37M]|nr:hypothetical protein E8E14_002782 [Neopestalotiopsis sp. 37M]
MAQLDPFVRGEDPACNAIIPQTCQVGDLSGKYSKITSDAFEATLPDDFGSLNIVSNAPIQDRSFVVHFANKTRITCAKFAVSNHGNATTNMTTSITPSYSSSGSGGVLPTTTTTATGTSGSVRPSEKSTPQQESHRTCWQALRPKSWNHQTMPRLEAQPQDGHDEGEEELEAVRQEQAGAVVGILMCIGTVAIFWAIVYCMNKWVHEAATQRQAALRHNGHGQGW